MQKVAFNSFDSKEQLEAELADKIQQKLAKAISQRGYASLVVSGGSTPKNLFNTLSNADLEWNKVYITLADERWLDANNTDANENLVRANLLKGKAAQAHFIGLKNEAATAEEGLACTEKALEAIHQPFDIVLLGMGNDGHTCSWFPCAKRDELTQALTSSDIVTAVTPTSAPYPRITLTRQAILNSRQIYLQLIGDQKLSVYQQALANDNAFEMPIRAVLAQQNTPVDVYWGA